jgi:hypothetical protein
MAVHGREDDGFIAVWQEGGKEAVDVRFGMVAEQGAFRQFEDTEGAVPGGKTLVALQVALIVIEQKIAAIDVASRLEYAVDFVDQALLGVILDDAGQDTAKQDRVNTAARDIQDIGIILVEQAQVREQALSAPD